MSKILVGLAYFSTSIQRSFHKIGKRKIEATVIINQKIAYLIVLIAGFILSSFHHERIKSNPQYNTNTIDNIQAVRTKTEITNNTKSQNSILLENSGELIQELTVFNQAYVTSTNDIYLKLLI